MSRHTVAFRLKHSSGSEPEAAFLKAAQILTSIPAVRNFEWLRQVSQKNKFEFGFSMEFASQQDYEAYNIHPEHVRFVKRVGSQRWRHSWRSTTCPLCRNECAVTKGTDREPGFSNRCERTVKSQLRCLSPAAHVKRWASRMQIARYSLCP